MPWNEVMDKWKSGSLKSGGSGKTVKSQKQAVAIMLSEKRAAMKGKAEYNARRSVMGRKVIHHSPDKHPEQGDQMTPEMMDKMVEESAKRMTGSYSNARQAMKPAQQPMPRDTGTSGGVLDYLKGLYRGNR